MNKKYILITLLIGFIAGVAYVGFPTIFGASLQNPGTKFSGSYENKTLLNASSTAGNSERRATSTPIQIAGAKKVQFQFIVTGTSTTDAVDFIVYVSPNSSVPDTQQANIRTFGYEQFTDLVVTNGTSPTTADTYYTRTGGGLGTSVTPAANVGATTTAAMDLSFGTWRSMICVASSSRHSVATCNALIEF